MSTEEELKTLILSKYGSIRKFSMSLDMPYTTLDAILKRGVGNASIGNVIKICDALSLSVDELAAGRISYKSPPTTTPNENALLSCFRSVNSDGQSRILDYAYLIADNKNMKKDNSNFLAI